MAPDSVALLLGARLVTRSNDTEYPFRQDSDFWYLTGFDQPDALAVLRNDGGPAFTLFVQPKDRAASAKSSKTPFLSRVGIHRGPRRRAGRGAN
jgi:Xaa-Pro aminopeptidase